MDIFILTLLILFAMAIYIIHDSRNKSLQVKKPSLNPDKNYYNYESSWSEATPSDIEKAKPTKPSPTNTFVEQGMRDNKCQVVTFQKTDRSQSSSNKWLASTPHFNNIYNGIVSCWEGDDFTTPTCTLNYSSQICYDPQDQISMFIGTRKCENNQGCMTLEGEHIDFNGTYESAVQCSMPQCNGYIGYLNFSFVNPMATNLTNHTWDELTFHYSVDETTTPPTLKYQPAEFYNPNQRWRIVRYSYSPDSKLWSPSPNGPIGEVLFRGQDTETGPGNLYYLDMGEEVVTDRYELKLSIKDPKDDDTKDTKSKIWLFAPPMQLSAQYPNGSSQQGNYSKAGIVKLDTSGITLEVKKGAAPGWKPLTVASGAILKMDLTKPGTSGLSDGTHTVPYGGNSNQTTGPGLGATFSVVVTNKTLTIDSYVDSGFRYEVGDTITVDANLYTITEVTEGIGGISKLNVNDSSTPTTLPDGTHSPIAITGGSGTGATSNITVTGGKITFNNIVKAGTGFVAGDVINIDTYTYTVIAITEGNGFKGAFYVPETSKEIKIDTPDIYVLSSGHDYDYSDKIHFEWGGNDINFTPNASFLDIAVLSTGDVPTPTGDIINNNPVFNVGFTPGSSQKDTSGNNVPVGAIDATAMTALGLPGTTFEMCNYNVDLKSSTYQKNDIQTFITNNANAGQINDVQPQMKWSTDTTAKITNGGIQVSPIDTLKDTVIFQDIYMNTLLGGPTSKVLIADYLSEGSDTIVGNNYGLTAVENAAPPSASPQQLCYLTEKQRDYFKTVKTTRGLQDVMIKFFKDTSQETLYSIQALDITTTQSLTTTGGSNDPELSAVNFFTTAGTVADSIDVELLPFLPYHVFYAHDTSNTTPTRYGSVTYTQILPYGLPEYKYDRTNTLNSDIRKATF